MTTRYKINEIFYSLQGEGYYTGTPAVFIRFSGCNLRCPFCDTSHGDGHMMTVDDILSEISRWPSSHVVLTGGEPSLYISESLVDALHGQGRYVAVETNGTHTLPSGVDWITCSPKFGFPMDESGDVLPAESARKVVLARCDELKVIYMGQDMGVYDSIAASHHFVQPCDTGDADRNRAILHDAIEFCKGHPMWRLSLQTHKLSGIRRPAVMMISLLCREPD